MKGFCLVKDSREIAKGAYTPEWHIWENTAQHGCALLESWTFSCESQRGKELKVLYYLSVNDAMQRWDWEVENSIIRMLVS
jgi:hypothetical protein